MSQAQKQGVVAEIGELLWPLLKAAYVGICIFNAVRLLLRIVSQRHADPIADILETCWPPLPLFWSPTGDSVLNFLIDTVVVILGGFIILGSLAGVLAVGCALLVIGIPLSFFLWLASLSIVGALIAGALSVGLIYLSARGTGRLAKKYLPPFVESMVRPYFALISRRQSLVQTKEVLVAKMANGEEGEELRGKLDKFRAQYPDMSPVPALSLEFTNWFSQMKQRFRSDQMRRTAEEEWKLRKQINELGAEYLRYLEIRRKTKSEQDLGGKRSKIESLRVEAELKQLEIENAQYDVELGKLQGKPSGTSQDRSIFEQKLKQLQRLGDEKEQALKNAKTEDEREMIEGVYQDQRMRILEGRD